MARWKSVIRFCSVVIVEERSLARGGAAQGDVLASRYLLLREHGTENTDPSKLLVSGIPPYRLR